MDEIENPLSERELEILRLVATGVTNAQVARALDISPNTVKVHLRNIFDKLDVESRTEAVTRAIRMGWVVLQPSGDGAASVSAAEDEGTPRPAGVALWKRIYLGVALLIVLALALIRSDGNQAAADPFIDHGASGLSGSGRATAARWAEAQAMPEQRARLAVVGLGNQLLAIGGDSNEGVSGAVELYDAALDTWSTRTSKPTPAANIGAVEIGGKVYVPGGYGSDGEALDVMEILDLATDSWTRGAPLPEPRFAYAIASLGQSVYVVGGSDGVTFRDTTYIYDTAADEWRLGPPVPGAARGFAAAAALDGSIYVLGGYDGAREYDACYAYSPGDGDTWTACPPMLAPRAGHAVVVAGGYLIVLGGGWSSYLYFNERYSPQDNAWVSVGSPILGQWRTLGAATLTQGTEVAVHAVGGWSNGYLDANERYRPFVYVNLPIIP